MDCSMPDFCLPLSPGVCSNSCPLSQWCYLTISSSAALFFCLQSFPVSGSFPISQLFTSCGLKYWNFSISTSNEHSGLIFFQFSSVQLLSCVWPFATPWTVAYQASLSITNSWSLLKLMSIESVMPSNHLILCHPLRYNHSGKLSAVSYKIKHTLPCDPGIPTPSSLPKRNENLCSHNCTNAFSSL